MKQISDILKKGFALLVVMSICMVSIEQIRFHHVHFIHNEIICHSHPYFDNGGEVSHDHSKEDFKNILLTIDLFHFVEATFSYFIPYTDFKTANLFIITKTNIYFNDVLLSKANKDPPRFC